MSGGSNDIILIDHSDSASDQQEYTGVQIYNQHFLHTRGNIPGNL